jgi:hypothetical protein
MIECNTVKRRNPMSQKIVVPPPVKVPYVGAWKAGTIYPDPQPKDWFKVDGPIARWGIVRSMQITVYRNGKPARNISQQDFGVKLYKGKIVLSMQFRDLYGDPAIDNYHVDATIHFLGQTIELDVDWPLDKKAMKPRTTRSRRPTKRR